MKGYKAFNADMKCRGFQYEVGKTYETEQAIGLCDYGFHFCKNIADCFKYYFSSSTRFAEVEALGDIIEGDDKCVTNKIRILKEISNREAMDMSNLGNWNSGHKNSGSWNSGGWNSGNGNSGSWNSGNWNSGDCNSGSWNSGGWNSGDWNVSSFNNGCFMTTEPLIMLFNKPSDWTYRDWIRSAARAILSKCPHETDMIEWITESKMSAAEKEEHPTCKTIGGYLKVTKGNANKQKWWDELPEVDKREVMSLPNFDAEIFKQCIGIEVGK